MGCEKIKLNSQCLTAAIQILHMKICSHQKSENQKNNLI